MNLPNRITLGRLATSVALFVGLVVQEQEWLPGEPLVPWFAFGVFVLTAGSDWFDGHIARARGEVTVLGRMMDPFVDKVLVCGTLIFLTSMTPDLWPPWMVVVIVSREFLVSGIRGYMESQGISFAAKMEGKVKMVLRCLAAGATLLLYAVTGSTQVEPTWFTRTCLVLAWVALLSTVYSGWVYARVFHANLARLDGAQT